jgi:tryptophan-rich sensory protein
MKIKKPKLLLLSILLTEGSGIIGSFATQSSVATWYQTINRPGFTPPSWLFAPVWTTLFLLMGIALYLVWVRKEMRLVKLFIIHLGFNVLWSYLFFGLQNPGLALIEIIFLVLFVAYLTYSFWKVHKWAGILLLPYLLWGTFATFLNFSIWRLN